MLILSRVCADFHNKSGALVHRVTPANRLTFHEAPDAIREDPLFRMLVEEGALEASITPVRQKELEADPLGDADAAGRTGPAGRPKAAGRRKAPQPVRPDGPAQAKTIDEP